jgi:tRNA-2-methylthio-N6-dimethylallyladenosine synthase
VTRRFTLRTYGCQMNVHDSEKVSNLLLHAGWAWADDPEQAELLLIHTCSIREKAEHRLYGDLGALRGWKQAAPGRLLGVGGCVAQQEGDAVLRRFAHLDFVFGTHNLRLVPALAEAAAAGVRQARTEETASLERFDLPERHPAFRSATPGRAWLTVMEGCDMFCTFCVVPRTRGREISRPAQAIVAEARDLAGRGVRELTLLGQTVNAYGRHDLRRGGEAGVVAFAELLRQLAEIPGVARLRYTSPHPIFVDEGLVRAHAELPALCPHLHLPLQSGSDRVLARMRRRHTAAAYLERVETLRRARPDLALTTDLIVGFPGESEADFEATLELVRAAGFVDAYAFKYSPRPGTVAARLGNPVAPELAQERLERLQALQRDQTLAYHRSRVGEITEILVEGPSRRGSGQMQGRDPQHRVVNVALAPDLAPPEPGSLLRVRLVEATPHSLIGEPAEAPGGRRPEDRTRVKEAPRLADEARRETAVA